MGLGSLEEAEEGKRVGNPFHLNDLLSSQVSYKINYGGCTEGPDGDSQEVLDQVDYRAHQDESGLNPGCELGQVVYLFFLQVLHVVSLTDPVMTKLKSKEELGEVVYP